MRKWIASMGSGASVARIADGMCVYGFSAVAASTGWYSVCLDGAGCFPHHSPRTSSRRSGVRDTNMAAPSWRRSVYVFQLHAPRAQIARKHLPTAKLVSGAKVQARVSHTCRRDIGQHHERCLACQAMWEYGDAFAVTFRRRITNRLIAGVKDEP